jgi:hypothetical protein
MIFMMNMILKNTNMKQRLQNLSSKGIMESGDHFKNGVNLQNLSSSKLFIKC